MNILTAEIKTASNSSRYMTYVIEGVGRACTFIPKAVASLKAAIAWLTGGTMTTDLTALRGELESRYQTTRMHVAIRNDGMLVVRLDGTFTTYPSDATPARIIQTIDSAIVERDQERGAKQAAAAAALVAAQTLAVEIDETWTRGTTCRALIHTNQMPHGTPTHVTVDGTRYAVESVGSRWGGGCCYIYFTVPALSTFRPMSTKGYCPKCGLPLSVGHYDGTCGA